MGDWKTGGRRTGKISVGKYDCVRDNLFIRRILSLSWTVLPKGTEDAQCGDEETGFVGRKSGKKVKTRAKTRKRQGTQTEKTHVSKNPWGGSWNTETREENQKRGEKKGQV